MSDNISCLSTVFLLSLSILLSSCKVDAQIQPTDVDVVYEVFVQSFYDSNGDGIGDLRGLINKLDYIQKLGATALWIMPIHPSPSYHKYDVVDYYAVHPDYGTMVDLEELIADLHKRDMKFILDFVVNHTSSEHSWFIEASKGSSNPYYDYYVWRNYDEVRDEIEKKTTTFDSDNITQWHTGREEKDRYYGFFWKGMPDLNFDNPKVREEVYKIGRFWIDKGVDGFRLDAARHIFPDDRFEDTRKFWEEFTMTMKAAKPDIKIIGEVWSDPATLATLFKGLPSLFNFEMTRTIPDMINAGNAHNFINSYKNIAAAYKGAGVPFEDAVILNNHDMNRIRSTLHGDVYKAKLAAAILLTLPGTPYIYYGEEIGMLGVKPDPHIREPFLWGEESFRDTSWLMPVHSTHQNVDSLRIQMDDQASVYSKYMRWIALRKSHPSLATGILEFQMTFGDDVLAFTMTGRAEKLLVIHNLTPHSKEINLPENGEVLSPMDAPLNRQINLDGYSSMLMKLAD